MTFDNRNGPGYGYSYDAAGRMAAFAINGVIQAEYEYNALGQQVIRRLTQAGQTMHVIHDRDGNRIAEYLYDASTGSSSLIREYIWANGLVVGVAEAAALYFVRTDHIGRPVFATDAGGAKVWEASYLPFGGVQASAGPNLDLRFPLGGETVPRTVSCSASTSGSSPRRACTRTGCGTTIRPQAGTSRPTHWG